MNELASNIQWLGHDGFFISGSKKICIDPFQIGTFSQKADFLLISHEHFDHYSPEDMQKVSGPNTSIIAALQAAEKISSATEILKPGDRLEKPLRVAGFPAYNTNKFREPGKVFHPKTEAKLGFVFELDGKRYYFAGDTDFIPEMKKLPPIDVAFLPVSGTYVMTAKEAAEAANTIKPKLAIPMHFGAIIGSEKDALEFKKLAQVPVEILQPKK